MRTTVIVTLILLAFAVPSQAGPFEDGISALDAGNYEAAAAAFERGAKEGHVEAMVELARLYLSGDGNRTVAAQWLKKAADGGSVLAYFLHGRLLLEGIDGPPDPAGARTYLEMAAKGQYAAAAYELGLLYRDGLGGERNAVAAARYLQQAANGHVLEAEHAFGAMQAFGQGIEPDVIAGGVLLKLAERGGDRDIRTDLDRLASLTTVEEMTEIDKRLTAHTETTKPMIGGDHVDLR